jgi:hypothetical protein
MAVFMQPIYTQTVGAGGSAGITFNNIPQGFDDLLILASLRDGRTDAAYANAILRINGNSSVLYNSANMFGVTSSAGSGNNLNEPWFFYSIYANGTVSTANTFSNVSIRIPNYTGGTFKNLICDSVVENNSMGTNSNILVANTSIFESTNPITSLTFIPVNIDFKQYTTITLYGISNAFDTAAPTVPVLNSITDQAGFFSIAFTPAANDQADSYVVESPAGTVSPVYGVDSPVSIPVEAQYNYNAAIRVGARNGLGTTYTSYATPVTTANNYASIATIAVSASINSVTFTNIPQNYSHLQLRCFGRSASGTYSQLDMNINGDASNAYTYHTMYGDGANAGAGASNPRSNIPQIADLIGTANTPGVSVVDILDYTATTKFKTVRWLYGHDLNGSGLVGIGGSAYMNVSPVTAITLTGRSQNIGQYSHFALYGIA